MAQIILDSNNNLIQGDFDNATLNNRTKLQTTTTNATTNVYIAPNGSSTSAGVSVANNSSLTNASKIVMATNGTTDTQIISGVNGSGTYLPLSFYTNNALAMQIGTNGQMTVAATANPTFSAYVASNQSISGSTNVKVPFNTEEWDTASCYDNTTNYRFTPNIAGYYQINAAVGVINSSTRALAMIWKNGVEFKRGNDCQAAVNGVIVSALVNANGTSDYFEIYVYTNATGTNLGGGANLTYFQASLARSA
jgi:hypothetical protein